MDRSALVTDNSKPRLIEKGHPVRVAFVHAPR
jgi:hypothetical protein